MVSFLLLKQLRHLRKIDHMAAIFQTQANSVNILRDSSRDNHLWGLMYPGIDHFHTSIFASLRYHDRTPIMPIYPRHCDQYPYLIHIIFHLNQGSDRDHVNDPLFYSERQWLLVISLKPYRLDWPMTKDVNYIMQKDIRDNRKGRSHTHRLAGWYPGSHP